MVNPVFKTAQQPLKADLYNGRTNTLFETITRKDITGPERPAIPAGTSLFVPLTGDRRRPLSCTGNRLKQIHLHR